MTYRPTFVCKHCHAEIAQNGVRDGKPDYLRADGYFGYSSRYCTDVYGQAHEPIS